MPRIAWLPLLLVVACRSGGDRTDRKLPYAERIPGTSITIRMLPVPSTQPTIWLSETEIPWDAYDAFVFGFDRKDPKLPPEADAAVRPSQPYITMDRAFGHAGYPVISVSALGASSFCAWLSSATGKRYRLPTEAEWELAATADGSAVDLDATSWTKANAGERTHPIGTKAPNAWGFKDLFGNAAEWCATSDGAHVVRGGSYKDGPGGAHARASKVPDPAWNKSDPQVPKSRWWLADGGFIGFRIAREE